MSGTRPNHLHISQGEFNAGVSFGPLAHVTPIHFAGNGHTPHIEARFVGGLRLSFTPATLIDLLREGQAAMAKLPSVPVLHDAVAGEE